MRISCQRLGALDVCGLISAGKLQGCRPLACAPGYAQANLCILSPKAQALTFVFVLPVIPDPVPF